MWRSDKACGMQARGGAQARAQRGEGWEWEEKDGSGKKGKGEVLQLRLTKMFEVVKAKKRGRRREKGTKVDVFVKFVNVVSP